MSFTTFTAKESISGATIRSRRKDPVVRSYTMVISLMWMCMAYFGIQHVKANSGNEISTPVCAVKWTEVRDVYSIRSHFNYTLHDLEECKRACVERIPGCVAIDVHGTWNHCYYHTQSLDQLEKNRRPYKGYTQLVLTKQCTASTVPLTTTIDATILQSFDNSDEKATKSFTTKDTQQNFTSDKSAPCTVNWTEFRDVFSSKARFLFETPDLELCKRACVENIPGCVAIEVHTKWNQCYYHTQSLDKLNETRKPHKGYTQLVLTKQCTSSTLAPIATIPGQTPQSFTTANEETLQSFTTEEAHQTFSSETSAPCAVKWTEVPDVYSTRSRFQFKIPDLENCKRSCIERFPGCVAIDVHKKLNLCYFHTQSLDQLKENRIPNQGYTQLVLSTQCATISTLAPVTTLDGSTLRSFTTEGKHQNISTDKPDPCIVKWTEVRDVYSIGSLYLFKIRDLEVCKKTCIESIPGCVAIDVQLKWNPCYYHTEPLQKVEKNRKPYQGYKQLILTKHCTSSTLPPTPTINEDTSQNLATPHSFTSGETPLNVFSDKPAPCAVKWTEVPDVYSTRSRFQFKIPDLENCKRSCIERFPGCVAIDVHKTFNLCYFHTQSLDQLKENRKPGIGYTQLVLTKECMISTMASTTTIVENLPQRFTTTHENTTHSFTTEGTHQNITSDKGVACAVNWTEVRDVYSLGSHFQIEINDLEACKRACIEKIPGCVAIDVHQKFDLCYYHIQALDKLEKNRKTYQGYTQLVVAKQCTSSTLAPLTTLDANTPQSFTSINEITARSFVTSDDKKTQVFSTTHADMYKSSFPTDENRSPSFATEDTHQTFPSGKSAPCAIKWSEFRDVYSTRARYQLKSHDLKVCKSLCIESIPGCVAIDVHKELNLCYFHTQSLDKLVRNQKAYQGYIQLILNKQCTPSTLPPSTTLEGNELQSFTTINEGTPQSFVTSDENTPQSFVTSDENTPQSFVTSDENTPQSYTTVETHPHFSTHKSAPCAVKWTEVPDVHSIRSRFQFKIPDLENCKRACIERFQDCVAIDVHKQFNLCYFHTQSLDKLKENRKPDKGYMQLVLTKLCTSSTMAPTTTTAEKAPQTFATTHENTPKSYSTTDGNASQSFTTKAACAVTLTEVHDVYSTGSRFKFKTPDLNTCKNACIGRISGCVAVDMHKTLKLCNFHTQSLDKLKENRIPYQGYTQLVLTKQCTSSTVAPNTAIYGNLPQSVTPSDETTLKSLTKVHENTPKSFTTSAEYRSQSFTVSGEKTLQTFTIYEEDAPQSFTTSDETTAQSFTTEETPRNVSSGQSEENISGSNTDNAGQPDCTLKFEVKYPGFVSFDAVAHVFATTEADCRSACVKDSSCMSYQIDLSPGANYCWLQNSFSPANLYRATSEVKEYIFVERCTNKPVKEKSNEDRCSPIIEVQNRNLVSHSATEHASVISEMECRRTCLRDYDCVSYQIDNRPDHSLCLIQKNLAMLLKDLYRTENIKEYIIVARCLEKKLSNNKDESVSLQAPETGCIFEKWEEYRDTYTLGAKLYSEVHGVEACKAACVQQIKGCLAVECHSSGDCWYHDKDTDFGRNRRIRAQIVLYVRIKSC